ncbi:hypothetical protein SAY87_005674 [Trapa incisa]|uniref:Phospholipase D n=1 Tax=Trapa incisa TaxID=236973 RepID=A0AAN7K6A1_9MYRT|nr:hypothetical protein SAY87_005674 [Trapa incisa]
MEGKQEFLHGTLEVTIFHATPYTPPLPCNCILAQGKPAYVTVRINQKKVAKTTHEGDRVWNQTFQVLCAHPSNSIITITVKTDCSILGKIRFQAGQFLGESSLAHGSFPVESEPRKPNPKMRLQMILWFKPAATEPGWRKLIGGGNFKGLRHTSFPLRPNCHVTLYQDAHHMRGFKPPIDHLCGGGGAPRRLWEDVFKAIDGAKYLIYIVGWSLNPKIVLVRDADTDIPYAVGVSLGELLKRKAEEGVAVRVMLWDDETSIPLIKNKGMMRTHDEDAFAYFRHTKVVCKLCPRLHHKFPTVFAHHQKTITLDAPPSSKSSATDREIVSFIGGLDLCDGRFDTEDHSLFHTLNTEFHSHDFYQTNIPGACRRRGGPRAPWHDTHACVRGEAAWDIMANFEHRWTKQCDPSLLFPASKTPSLSRSGQWDSSRDWHVQVFRSIDHVSATHSPLVERSIHEAYVEAIRRADRFLYIENQYFIGGSHLWARDSNCGCGNLIPVEIALKVASKVRAGERFGVYIVIPLWPEGMPESETVQEILHWTRETMEMMYRLIGEAIIESRREGHPRDYLNFYCLSNREGKREGEMEPQKDPRPSSQYWNAQKHRRFMVYVHSKLMIVDDVYLLIGSANINQRSMDGQRDTEIAIGCYQNRSKEKRSASASGRDIQAYRMSLWYEHTRQAQDLFMEPESLECVNAMREIGDRMWGVYRGEEVVDMEGVHLMSYPVQVTPDGRVDDIGGSSGAHGAGAVFPDTKATIRGRRSKVLPPVATT